MASKELSNIDMNNLEILNLRLQQLAGAPGTPVEGLFWYDPTAGIKHPVFWDGAVLRIVPHLGATVPTTETVAQAAAAGSSLEVARIDHKHALPGQATTGADGFMSAADKALLANAVPTATVSTLMKRDSAGRAQAVDPVANADIATKSYVDAHAMGQKPKDSVRLATAIALPANAYAANVITATIFGVLSVDGINAALGDRILVKNEATAANNGVYTVTTLGTASVYFVLTRATDFNVWTEIPSSFFFSEVGTTNADCGWTCISDAGGTLGTTAIAFTQTSGPGAWKAGTAAGATGVAVLDNTTGNTFNFRAIKSANGKITITLVGQDLVITDTGTLQGKYAANIGDGVATSIVVTHGLGTQDIVPSVRLVADNSIVYCDMVASTSTTATFTFVVAPALNSLRVTIVG